MNKTSLSSLRLIGVIVVILFHNRNSIEALKIAPKVLTAGPEMVTFFYVLSGFVLMQAYYSRDPFLLKEYLVKRTARIAPVYFLSLFLSLATIIFASKKIDPIALILHISFLQAWFPPYPLSINPPAWFLSGLLFFYLTFPAILALVKKNKPHPKAFLLAALLFWVFTQIILTYFLNNGSHKGFPSTSHDLINYFPFSHYCSFVLGCAVSYFLIINKDIVTFLDSRSRLLKICSFLLVIISLQYKQNFANVIHLNLPFGASFFAPLFVFVIISFSVASEGYSIFFSRKIFMVLGKISFTIYIMQMPVRFFLHKLLDNFISIPEFFIVIYLFVLISICLIIYHMIEKPIYDHVISSYIVNSKNK